jgi:exonuclease VII small subunit
MATRGSEKDNSQAGTGAVAVTDLSYSDAGAQLDAIIEEFETGVVDVDHLVEQLERATDIVDELDRRLRRTRMRVEELVPRLESIGRVDEGDEVEVVEIDEIDIEIDGDSDGDGDGEVPVDRHGKTPGLF